MLIDMVKLLSDDTHEIKEITEKCADVVSNCGELSSERSNIRM